GLTADWPRVFAEAARLDKAVEIDCYPDRQDLNLGLLNTAKKEGVRLSLGTDAHHSWQLEFIELGLAAVLRAKIAPEKIINFFSLEQLRLWVRHSRGTADCGFVDRFERCLTWLGGEIHGTLPFRRPRRLGGPPQF